VTEADLAADALLKQRLRSAFPDAGWLSEETADDSDRLTRRALIVVDPIDGTRAFVSGDPRWAVSAALVIDGRPVAGVVHAPALDETYAAARGAGAELNGEKIRVSVPTDPLRLSAAGPKAILQAMGAKLGASLEISPRVPSLAYRLCMFARGSVQFAVAAENGHDWDIAAADLLVEEAGGRLVEISGERLIYNRSQVQRSSLLAAPTALVPRLLHAFRAAVVA
jgi:myo-inositol-1(or 4)-monophosphatase